MDYSPPGESTVDEFELGTVLARLGLGQYEEILRENGFETWRDVTAILEIDLAELGFKLGDRRKLQGAIHEYSSSNPSHAGDSASSRPLSSEGLPLVGEISDRTHHAARTTRRYRRHPRPDPSAPQKPKTAYVLFGEQVRQDPALNSSSFAELAKETGKRWRELSDKERQDAWERPVANKLQQYKEELNDYKQTEDYKTYQTYLDDFKQGRPNPESILPPKHKASSTGESGPSDQPPAPELQGEEETGSTGARQESVDTDEIMQDQTRDPTSPVEDGMGEVRHIAESLGLDRHLTRVTAFPPEDMTIKAVEAFMYGTGSLIFLWNQNESSDIVRTVYHPESDLKPAVYTTEAFAMAAVGSYCDGDSHSLEVQGKFLQFFLYTLSSSSDMSDLRYMRLFACLAICRFTNSVESARRLMLSALSIGRQTFTSPSFESEMTKEVTRYWWSVFQSVVFLESWFAYNTSQDSRVNKDDLTLYHPPSSSTGQGPGVFHERVGELGQLAAYIAFDLKTASQPKVAQARAHFQSLNEWHRTLPPPMQLSRLSLADPLSLNWHTKRSLLQLHILFLGLFIEPYRNCLIDIAKFRLGDSPTEPEEMETLKNIEEQCVLAARQSARVAALLQSDNSIRSHCWVSLYTSFTGCALLLFSASQKLLGFYGEEIGQDLSYASSHLNVLSFCSYENLTARALYSTLLVIFNDIREIMVSPTYRTMRSLDVAVKEVALAPPSDLEAIEGAVETSKNMLDVARRVMCVLREKLSF
ncbi:hypothetical protein BDV95DRAFT_602369 [Massariosphaeria phaeospora]|uniref:HMG box domain-containing protein n=1 Tax=Massariosphaeria phaeospora TaxID=100035 RepID=A0A7C8MFJ4_9PLEO|nr:hypothetical protein BDV95DRAFT_602369 [Massariosphaeria phaeospora]